MGNPELEFRTGNIKKLSGDLKNTVAPKFDQAMKHIDGDGTIEGGDFSIVGTVAAMSYPIGLQYAFQDLATHKRQVEKYADAVAASAENYRKSEESSTVKRTPK
ncbi:MULTISPECIES: hypothetical protein [Thermomonospora]|mgnify:CR=1 FL=1|uniref:Uncharacterized protein n=1 Tax=Thermomonospora curvata (strain ATCC 19995 / DSM 43183 / JCM 3096 / KCTC 9072 / NBRC 15933 / NCIMB 10081 / Henssen B9) TaxID=471852 RepID=D1A8B3_THECD|nr:MULTISPECIES: hypothetical protein [Thermomonospora]ACZ00428.1 hypothetical protein Tcur_4912 [Thermomonospora curvata DSM 43183]PKK11811.1 MAG: hypothetical protein BUE48_023725 [Thermomonospora sp. CIF 1]